MESTNNSILKPYKEIPMPKGENFILFLEVSSLQTMRNLSESVTA